MHIAQLERSNHEKLNISLLKKRLWNLRLHCPADPEEEPRIRDFRVLLARLWADRLFHNSYTISSAIMTLLVLLTDLEAGLDRINETIFVSKLANLPVEFYDLARKELVPPIIGSCFGIEDVAAALEYYYNAITPGSIHDPSLDDEETEIV